MYVYIHTHTHTHTTTQTHTHPHTHTENYFKPREEKARVTLISDLVKENQTLKAPILKSTLH